MNNEDRVTLEVKLGILRSKRQLYINTYYAHSIDARVGKDIDEEELVETAKANMRTAQQCIDSLEKMIEEVKTRPMADALALADALDQEDIGKIETK